MSITTHICTFDFNIPAKYFPMAKVIKPFYAVVCYESDDAGTWCNVRSITFTPHTLQHVSINQHLLEDIEKACWNNIISRMPEAEQAKL